MAISFIQSAPTTGAFAFQPIVDETVPRMTRSAIQRTLQGVCEHVEDDDPQPEQILISPNHVTLQLKSVDDLLDWTDEVAAFFEEEGGSGVTFTAQLLWKQAENEPAPTVITAIYDWEFADDWTVTFRIYASSPITMDQLDPDDIYATVDVTRDQVETLMIQSHATKAGIPYKGAGQ